MVGLKMGRKSSRARAPKLSATPFAIRSRDRSTSSMTSTEKARTVPPSRADWGITLYASPACILVTETTAVSVGGTLRATTDWNRAHHVRSDDDRVHARLGAGAVRSHPFDVDVEERPAGHHRSRADRKLADRELRPIVDAEDRVARELLEQPVLDHRLGAAEPLFGRLEDEEHLPLEAAGLGEITRRAEKHRGMPIVPARVHPPIVPRLVFDPRRLLDRQRVHVRPEPHRTGRVADPERSDHPGAPDTPVDLEPELLEPLRHQVGGPVLLEAKLGMGVDVAPPCGHLVVKLADSVDYGHGQVSSFASSDSSSWRCTFPEALRGKSSKPMKRIPFGCL